MTPTRCTTAPGVPRPPGRGRSPAVLRWTAQVVLLAALALGCESRVELLHSLDASDANPDAARAIDASAAIDGGDVDRCRPCAEGSLCNVHRCVDVAGVRSLGSHFSHTCYLDDGRLFCFGRNSAGQLGLGTNEHRSRPTRVGDDNDWLTVSVGEESTCGLRAPGRLTCWGNNSYGQLGHGDTQNRARPTPVGDRHDWLQVACGGWNCCAVSDAQGLHCWGANLEGKPGQGDSPSAPDLLAPAPIASVVDVHYLSNGQGHLCAIDGRDSLHCWGRNSEGQTGAGPMQDQYRAPEPVAPEHEWACVSAGRHHTCAVTHQNTLYCWGDNTQGETGIPGLGEVTDLPTRVTTDSDWTKVAVGGFHSCALKRDGTLHCWGRATEGQLGRGDDEALVTPTPIAPERRWLALALGPFHSCALSQQQQLYCWGANDYGQLGVGDNTRRMEPTPVVP